MTDYDKLYADAVLNDYSPKSSSRAIALKKLDAKAKLPSYLFTYTCGLAGALMLGAGMCLSMRVIGSGTTAAFVGGVILGIAGIAAICVNYPIFRRMQENGKKKYAADILELAKEILDS